jgi:hypothetical protein
MDKFFARIAAVTILSRATRMYVSGAIAHSIFL